MPLTLNAFILAAGLGERLRPITDHIPKPLIPILGKPVLQSVLERVSALSINKIGINLHHKKEDIENWIKQSLFAKKVELFPEDPILGTGGALKNAEVFLKNSIFLVHNSDIISDMDLNLLIEYHLSSDDIATLAVHDYPEFNNLEIDEEGYLLNFSKHPHLTPLPTTLTPPSSGGRGLGGGGAKYLAFTGIAAYNPEFLQFLPEGNSSVVDAWFNAISAGHKVGTMDVSGCYWTDIGTPASYAKAVVDELRRTGEKVCIHPSVKCCKDIEFDGYVVIENESISNKRVSLRNCIVLPGTKIEIKDQDNTDSGCLLTLFWGRGAAPTKSSFENCILGPGFKIDFSESDLFESDDGSVLLIGTGGSDRKYYRVRNDKHPVVLMQCSDDDPDFQRHIEYTHFFKKYSIPVPELIDVETDKKKAFFEDLGDLSLYSWLKCPREQKDIEKIYRQVIDMLVLIHTAATEHVSACPLLQKRIFDYAHLRWETSYFVERFVEGIRNIKADNLSALNDEFHRLALKVDSFRKTVVHRDFQSQNIMITRGKIPKIVDYQGARIGPPAYDVVSLLWDPYFRLENNSQEWLLNYYIRKMTKNTQWFREKEFRESIIPCRLQRHMQALGAYGFLSSVKGKKYFLKYVPEGLRLLREGSFIVKNEFPVLDTLIKKI
jgi:NDP-sugar pyrophosphorylase family protein